MNTSAFADGSYAKGSAFFENERKRDQMVTERIERMMAKYNNIRDIDLSMETRITDGMVLTTYKEKDTNNSTIT